MRWRSLLSNSAILGGVLGLYMFSASDSWLRWVVLAGALVMLGGGLWQSWRAAGRKQK